MMQNGQIWVLAECRGAGLTRGTEKLLELARGLAQPQSMSITGVLLGQDQEIADRLAARVDRVLWVSNSALTVYESTRWLSALKQLLEKQPPPAMVLAVNSAMGLELMPRLGLHLKAGYASSVVELGWNEGNLLVRRPIFGGRAYEELAVVETPAVFTVRATSSVPIEQKNSPGEIETIPVDLPKNLGLEVIKTEKTSLGKTELSEAERIVAGGRGMGSEKNFQLIEELAECLGAAVGASRAVVDAGWRSQDDQVGKSGKTVSPQLYMAFGISGAIHHVLGMNTSKVVVAVNKDPEAQIFKNADIGLVADTVQIIPAITEALKKNFRKE